MKFGAIRNLGVQSALLSAVLFGAGTPFAKMLLDNVSPWLLAGLLYTGSGVGLSLIRVIRRSPRVTLGKREIVPFAGAIFFGGVLAPVLLLVGLSNLTAGTASLLLNAEAVFTAVIAWVVFSENVDRRIVVGMLAIVAGAVVLSAGGGLGQSGGAGSSGDVLADILPTLAVLGACLCWGIDNNLTRTVALTDAMWLAAVKGGVAGPVNLVLAMAVGAQLPAVGQIAAAMSVGFFAYGVSLALFIVGMRHTGTARAGAYFAIAPFFGAALAVVLGEPITLPLVTAGLLMAVGIWLHLSEKHVHEHTHEAITHDHSHVHDEHHRHEHEEAVGDRTRHSHVHTHNATTHTHEHYPDSHHRHDHPRHDA